MVPLVGDAEVGSRDRRDTVVEGKFRSGNDRELGMAKTFL